MGYKKNETGGGFLHRKTLAFGRNFLANYDGLIQNEDCFCFIEREMAVQGFEKWVAALHPKKVALGLLRSHNMCAQTSDFPGPITDWLKVLCIFWNERKTREKTRTELIRFLDSEILSVTDAGNDGFAERFGALAEFLKFSETETNIFLFAYLCGHNLYLGFRTTGDRVETEIRARADLIALHVDSPVSEVLRLTGTSGRLQKFGCLDPELEFAPSTLDEYLDGLSSAPFSESFYKKSEADALPWHFFSKSRQEEGLLLERLLKNKHQEQGFHVLLYGDPGTGKTSFARALADHLGRKSYEVAINEKNRNPYKTGTSAGFRFRAAQICDEQVHGLDSIIILDEADNMLCDGVEDDSSGKARINGFLDSVRTPCIWIANLEGSLINASTRRRFDYSICFERTGVSELHRVWDNTAALFNLEERVTKEIRRTFAAKYPVNAGGVAIAMRNLRDLNPAPEEVPVLLEKLLAPYCALMEMPSEQGDPLAPACDYLLEGLNINGKIPLPRIEAAVRRFQAEAANCQEGSIDRPRMNLLLSGPPGTGKTEFVKYLGRALGVRVLVKTGADLLGKFVGETEKRLAAAFREAEGAESILFLDEIDGFLQSREQANRSWEVTQVNQLLQLMEGFKGILIGATNFSGNLDSAALRRFTFKLRFEYLDNSGKQMFFERMFGTKLDDSERKRLFGISSLAPGDFRTVRQGLYYLDEGNSPNDRRIDALEEESLRKQRGGRCGAIGFQCIEKNSGRRD